MATIKALTGRFDPAEIARGNGNTTIADAAKDAFWSMAVIDETKWCQLYPYQLLILQKNTDGQGYQRSGILGSFTLPIPPQQMGISLPFAMSASVSTGGIIEENNGAPIRLISLSGTTGHLPLRNSPYKPRTPLAQLGGTIFAGSLQGINQTTAAVQQIVNPGVFPLADNVVSDDDIQGALSHSTGYAQFHLLKQFLEQYAFLRRSAQGKNYRLAFAIWKDDEIHIVTPMNFELQRSAPDSPLEYKYSLSLKSWRRIAPAELDQGFASIESSIKPLTQDPTALSKLLSRVSASRKALQGLKNVLTGFRGDVDSLLFNPLRQVTMFVKDLLGAGLTALDLPVNILKDLKSTIILAATVPGLYQTLNTVAQNELTRLSGEVQQNRQALVSLGDQLGISTSGVASAGAGQADAQSRQAQSFGATDPSNAFFDSPDDNADLFSSFPLSTLSIPPSINKKIVTERQNNRALNRDDFATMRDTVQKLMVDYSNFVGVGSSVYAANYGLLPPAVTTRTPTDDDWEILFNLNQVVLDFSKLASSRDVDTTKTLSSMDYVAALSQSAGIKFKNSVSKFAVPFPVGSTLEMVALTYLKDDTRWIELAILNNLRSPYVDEVGFDLPLLANGRSNQVEVSSATNLYVGQPVWLQSSSKNRELHHILSIRSLSPSNFIIGLDGDPTLERFLITDAAQLFAFLPGTINSTQLIFIPSDDVAPVPDFQAPGNSGYNQFDPLLQTGGVDLLLTQQNDVFMTPDGDSRYAVGLQNILQTVRITLSTPQGSLIQHPEFGLSLQPGTSVADLTADQLLSQMRAIFSKDPTFTDISSASVLVAPPAVQIQAVLGIAGWSQLIPVSFQVRT